MLMSLVAWPKHAEAAPVLLVGDSKSALQDSIEFKGRNSMLAVARELAWRTARLSWKYQVGHLASEHNDVPDALSRLEAPSPKPFPAQALAGAKRIPAPSVQTIWKMNHTLAKA